MKTSSFAFHTKQGTSVDVRTWEQNLGTVAA